MHFVVTVKIYAFCSIVSIELNGEKHKEFSIDKKLVEFVSSSPRRPTARKAELYIILWTTIWESTSDAGVRLSRLCFLYWFHSWLLWSKTLLELSIRFQRVLQFRLAESIHYIQWFSEQNWRWHQLALRPYVNDFYTVESRCESFGITSMSRQRSTLIAENPDVSLSDDPTWLQSENFWHQLAYSSRCFKSVWILRELEITVVCLSRGGRVTTAESRSWIYIHIRENHLCTPRVGLTS